MHDGIKLLIFHENSRPFFVIKIEIIPSDLPIFLTKINQSTFRNITIISFQPYHKDYLPIDHLNRVALINFTIATVTPYTITKRKN